MLLKIYYIKFLPFKFFQLSTFKIMMLIIALYLSHTILREKFYIHYFWKKYFGTLYKYKKTNTYIILVFRDFLYTILYTKYIKQNIFLFLIVMFNKRKLEKSLENKYSSFNLLMYIWGRYTIRNYYIKIVFQKSNSTTFNSSKKNNYLILSFSRFITYIHVTKDSI